MEEIAGVKTRYQRIFEELKAKSLPKSQNQVNLFGLNSYPYPKNLEKTILFQKRHTPRRHPEVDQMMD